MSIYEFLERLEADPFDPEIIAIFDPVAAKSARSAAKEPPEWEDIA